MQLKKNDVHRQTFIILYSQLPRDSPYLQSQEKQAYQARASIVKFQTDGISYVHSMPQIIIRDSQGLLSKRLQAILSIFKKKKRLVTNGNIKQSNRCEPERVSKHAAVTGHPSKFNRLSLCKPEPHKQKSTFYFLAFWEVLINFNDN